MSDLESCRNRAVVVQLWVIGLPGLEDFSQSIGHPRNPGEAALVSFDRPETVVEVERTMGFAGTKAE